MEYLHRGENTQGVHNLHVVRRYQFAAAVVISSTTGDVFRSVEPVDADVDILGVQGTNLEDAGYAFDVQVAVARVEGLWQRLEAGD